MALYLKATLEQEGYLVSTAETAEAAVHKVRVASGPGAFDLILTDLNLPDAAGTEILRHLGKCENCPPRIVLSADNDTGIREAAYEAGAAGYVEKPFNVSDLKGVIEEKCVVSHTIRHHDGGEIEQLQEQLKRDYYIHLGNLSRQLDDPMPFKNLKSLVHQIKGSAALYGLDALADLAKQLDATLSAKGQASSSDVRRTLRDHLHLVGTDS